MIGQQFGPYRIVSKLGAGGMGAVYLAEHDVLKRKAVVKVLDARLRGRSDQLQRFYNEARAASAVEHPDVVDVYDMGTTADGVPYILMEYLKGRSLHDLLKHEGVQPEVVTRALGFRVARALGATHAKGIIHRDLKPGNVFLTPDPEKAGFARVKLLDFGIAKLAEASLEPGIETRTEALLGTPSYMSPEQCEGAKNADARSDVYALGVLLYEMLLGRLPFEADTLGGLLKKQMFAKPDRPRALDPRISEDMERIVLRCLEKEPAARFQTMEELASALGVAGTPGAVPFVDTQDGTTKLAAQGGPTAAPPLLLAVAGPVAPTASPTTLRTSAAEISVRPAAAEAPRRKAVAVGILAAVFLTGGLGAYFGLERLIVEDDVSPTAAPLEEDPATNERAGSPPAGPASAETRAASGLEIASAAPSPAPAESRVTIRVDSAPTGAAIHDLSSGAWLGSTPHEITVDAGSPPRVVRLTRAGYEPSTASLPVEGSGTVVVKLKPLRAKTTRASAPPKAID